MYSKRQNKGEVVVEFIASFFKLHSLEQGESRV